jgi:hypothetical protein
MVLFDRAEFSGGTVSFKLAQFTDSEVSFLGAQFTAGAVSFGYAEFTGGTVRQSVMPFSASPARSCLAGEARSRGQTADQRSKRLDRLPAIRPLSCDYLVAGAGFDSLWKVAVGG